MVDRFYDQKLGYPFGFLDKRPPFNPRFSDFSDHIYENMNDPSICISQRYDTDIPIDPEHAEQDLLLLRSCQEHARSYSNGSNKDVNVILVHPFYGGLCEFDNIEGYWNMESGYDTYSKNLLEVLSLKSDSSRASLTLVDDSYSYASLTSLYVERGIFDNVLFTENHSGKLYDASDYDPYLNDTNYIGGGYNLGCFSHFISGFHKRMFPEEYSIKGKEGQEYPLFENLYIVPSLVLNRPSDVLEKFPWRFWKRNMSPETIEEIAIGVPNGRVHLISEYGASIEEIDDVLAA